MSEPAPVAQPADVPAAAVAKPSVLFVYFTYTNQTAKVLDVMAEELRTRGCAVTMALLEFNDPRYDQRFKTFPMPHPFREVLGMIPAELSRKPEKIGVPDAVTAKRYDLVVFGSPTWWLSTNVPIRSFLESDTARQVLQSRRFTAAVVCRRYWKHNLKTVRRLGGKQGGDFVEGVHFRYEGGQVRSLLSLISYLGSGKYRERYLGIKIPPTNIRDFQLQTARTFADGLADRLVEPVRAT
jgi:menaquinone-dependent protoporphyrinogen IX oxidase